MQYIKAPFNFVAVSNEVYFPDWADQISHDIPFSDGLSGQLEIELEAKTPIFIRDSNDETLFCHVQDKEQKKYFIPGTSLKGTIRSILEILSFGKMDKINDHKFAIRDLHNPLVYNLMKDSAHIRCGWLSIEKDENGNEARSIRDCGIPWRISHQQLDTELGTTFVNTFKKEDGTADFTNDSNKTAAFKYGLLPPRTTLTGNFEKTTENYGKQLCDFDSSGKPGTLVFTGQAGARKTTGRPSGKFYEFVFVEQPTLFTIEVDAKTWEEFKFHYFDHDPNHISADWKWRKGELKDRKEIPVFFRLSPTDHSKVKDLGLAYLYKMPYKYSVKDLLPPEHRLGFFKPDMAECIFGNANEKGALKGRVQFSTAWADMKTVKEGEPITTILGTPKASYYPIYIKQDGVNGRVSRDGGNRPLYKTFMDKDAKLAGRKRYPIRESAWEDLPAGTDNMQVSFTPLKSGAKFSAKIRYFNLRPAELGALLSALTFHNNANKCYHGIGMAKPYGFGRVSLTIKGIDKKKTEEYLKEFESEINAYMQVENPEFKWNTSDPIKEFIALSKLQRIEDAKMRYMKLPEFAKAKTDEKDRGIVLETHGFYLEDYSTLSGDSKGAKSLITDGISEEKKKRAEIVRKQVKEEIDAQAKDEASHENEVAEKERLITEEKRRKEQEEAQKARLEAMAKEKEALEKKDAEERLRLETLQKEMEQRKAEEKARIEEKHKRLKEAGLEPLIQEEKNFNRAKKSIDFYMKHTGVDRLNDDDISAVMEKATEWYQSTRDKIKEKRWGPTDGPDWKKIASWVGTELAQKWYDDLIG